MRVMRHWHRLHRDVVDALSLEVFNLELWSSGSVPVHSRGTWNCVIFMVPSKPFYDSMNTLLKLQHGLFAVIFSLDIFAYTMLQKSKLHYSLEENRSFSVCLPRRLFTFALMLYLKTLNARKFQVTILNII